MRSANRPSVTAPLSKLEIKKRRNRRQVLWTICLATVTVLSMTIYDMRFRTEHASAPLSPAGAYYITKAEELDARSSDTTPLIIWQGHIGTQGTHDKNLTAPINIPQRQIGLSFALTGLSKEAIPRISQQIAGAVDAWERKSNLIMDIFLDVRALDKDKLAELDALITAIHKKNQEYRYSLTIDPAAANTLLAEQDSAKLAQFLQRIYSLNLVAKKDEAETAKTIAAADRFERPFTVTLPTGANPSTFAAEATAKAKYFRSFITAPDTQHKGTTP